MVRKILFHKSYLTAQEKVSLDNKGRTISMENTEAMGKMEPDLRINLSHLCEEILSLLLAGDRIQHSMLEKLITIVVTQIFDMGNNMENIFDELSNAIKIAYQTASFSEEYEQGFEMGALYSIMISTEHYKRKQQEDAEMEEIKKYVEKEHRTLLIHAIEKVEGISQKELLDTYNASTSNKSIKKARLSQILTELKERKIVYCISVGKEKYYYLTRRGKNLAGYLNDNTGKTGLTENLTEQMAMLKLLRTLQEHKKDRSEEIKETDVVIDGLPTDSFYSMPSFIVCNNYLYVPNEDNRSVNSFCNGKPATQMVAVG